MKQNSGMTLMSTLIMLGFVALMVLSQMQMNFLYYQFSQQRIIRHQEFRDMEQGLRLVRSRISHFHSKPYLLEGTLSFNDRFYRYLIEDLGHFPCVQSQIKQVQYSTRHWLVTLSPKAEKTRQFIQIRLAQLEQLQDCPSETISMVQPGLLSWRLYSGQRKTTTSLH